MSLWLISTIHVMDILKKSFRRRCIFLTSSFRRVYPIQSTFDLINFKSPKEDQWRKSQSRSSPHHRAYRPNAFTPMALGLAPSGSAYQWCDMDHSTNKKNVDLIQPLQIRTSQENKGEILWFCYNSKITVHG